MQLFKRIGLLLIVIVVIVIGMIYNLDSRSISNLSPKAPFFQSSREDKLKSPMMSKMGNETAKAILGKAGWHLLHTITVKYPIDPTPQNQNIFVSFIENFSVLYPCGDCARHFQVLLKKYPPKTGSREELVLWLCKVHNMVNERLKKKAYDCTKVQENYSCGCDPE